MVYTTFYISVFDASLLKSVLRVFFFIIKTGSILEEKKRKQKIDIHKFMNILMFWFGITDFNESITKGIINLWHWSVTTDYDSGKSIF